MRLRLLIEIEADADTVDALRIQVERQAPTSVDLRDGYPALTGALVGAVPVENGAAV